MAVWSGIVWKEGVRRGSDYLLSDLCVLDFDDGEMTVEQAAKSFCDMRHIIGTTKSHQIAKDGKPACDRFRVILQWETRITDPLVYTVNMEAMCRRYPMDVKTKDLARYFFPCVQILHVGEGELVEVKPRASSARLLDAYYQSRRREMQAQGQESGGPRWLHRFLTDGVLVASGGRNNTIYAAARALKELGVSESEARSRLNAAPFSRDGWRDGELDSALRSAYKK